MIDRKTNYRAGLVDGLPMTYDTSFILSRKQKCGLCERQITKSDIENNSLIYTDEFEFCHKSCIEVKKIEYKHLRPKDLSSPITLVRKKGKAKSAA